MKTTHPNVRELPRAWHLVDAEGLVLGRMAARIARVLQGKHRPIYSPHIDTGEFVVVVNAEKVKLTGRKEETWIHRYHTQWPGGLREVPRSRTRPEDVIRLAVQRMLPKTKLGRRMLGKLKIYSGAAHPHEAQVPKPLDLATV